MPFNGAGVFSPPSPPVYPAVSGQLIRSADYNAVISDIAAALTNCVTKDNQSTVPLLTLGALTVTSAAALGSGSTVAGETILTRRYTTGEVILSVSSTAPTGTVALNGQTIGSATSGATGRANADTQALFELLWATADNTLLPIQDAAGGASSRGLTAAADFAANKRLPLPTPQDGDALLLAVSSGVLTRTVGANLSHTHAITVDAGGNHSHSGGMPFVAPPGIPGGSGGSAFNAGNTGDAGLHTHTANAASSGGSKNLAAGFYLRPYIAL